MLHRYQFPTALLLLTAGLLVALLATFAVAKADTRAPLSGQLELGMSGSDVTSLQQFLAANPLIYPQGLVTGYYGPLTENAVKQFQIGYGIEPVGRVGPVTLAKMNALITAGTPIDVSAPILSNIAATPIAGGATVSWSTNEQTTGIVYYSAQPIVSYETGAALTQPTISGTPVSDTTISTSHSVSITGLQTGQTYYYVVDSVDLTGNVSITLTGSFVAR